MTENTIRVSPPNSMVIISDAHRWRVPELSAFVPTAGVISTESCIVVFCEMEQDGETSVTVGATYEIDPGTRPVFDGTLETPTRTAIVSTVEWKQLLRSDVATLQTRVRIWTNRPLCPNEVIIGLEDDN
jgi:hypothetical protein